MVQEISAVSMKAGKKVIPRRYYLFPRKHLNCPWNYRIYRTNCKRSRTTLSGRRSVAPGKFSTETTQKVVFHLLVPTVFSGHFLLMINNQHLHDFHGGLLWASRRFHGFSHSSLFHEEVVIQAHLVFSWWKALSCVQKAQCDRILWLFRLLFALNLPSDLWM